MCVVEFYFLLSDTPPTVTHTAVESIYASFYFYVCFYFYCVSFLFFPAVRTHHGEEVNTWSTDRPHRLFNLGVILPFVGLPFFVPFSVWRGPPAVDFPFLTPLRLLDSSSSPTLLSLTTSFRLGRLFFLLLFLCPTSNTIARVSLNFFPSSSLNPSHLASQKRPQEPGKRERERDAGGMRHTEDRHTVQKPGRPRSRTLIRTRFSFVLLLLLFHSNTVRSVV